jgi:UPF0716 protein FxsA
MVRSVLVVLFLILPVLELLVLVQVAQAIGGLEVFLLLVAQGLLGSWIVRREGTRAWRRLNEAVASGRMPEKGGADAALTLAGGLLLALPGLLTDVPALLCLLPFTRPLVRRGVTAWAGRRIGLASQGLPFDPYGQGYGPTIRRDGTAGPGVIRGEVIRDEEDGGPGEPRRPLEP